MVLSQIDDLTHTGQIVLTPNASCSWQTNLKILAIVGTLSLTIALGFLAVGAWTVLLYSILEIAGLGLAFYYCAKQCNRQEVITVEQHEVLLERGFRVPQERLKFHRTWSKFLVQTAQHPWDPARVSISSRGHQVEIGSFLNRQDKCYLIEQLHRVVDR